MSYGLYDGDWQFYTKIPVFNLELMKYSTYYKHKHEIVSLMPNFEPNMYSNVIVRQDFYNSFGYSYQDNIIYGGRAFDGENYKPLPLDIEVMKPDIQLYERIKNKLNLTDALMSGWNTMRRAEHLRLSLDGHTIWPDFERQLIRDKNSFGLFFHDYNLAAIDGAHDVIQYLLDNFAGYTTGRRIGMKFPVQTSTLPEFDSWVTFAPLNKYFSIQYNGLITPNDYDYLVDLRKRSTGFSQATWNITRGMDYDTFITTGIVQIFETILDLRSRDINFSLIFDKDFFKDARWKDVVQLICMFSDRIGRRVHHKQFAKYYYTETMYNYCKLLVRGFVLERIGWSVPKLRDIFQFIQKNNYELFVRFYEYNGEVK